MRRLVVACAVVLLASCSVDDGQRYLNDRAFRRQALVASLVNPANHYSALRLAHYATGATGDWEQLPEWNPPTARRDDPGSFAALDLDAADLGARAFSRYPVQPAPVGIEDGVVLVRYVDGTIGRALTCASCHGRLIDGAMVMGPANQTIDLGWGPGLVDVSSPPGEAPVAIPDLRPVRFETHLQRAGAVRQTPSAVPVALAIRIETLMITAQARLVRPPRVIPLALARYLFALAPAPSPAPATSTTGAVVFAQTCGGCHAAPGRSGPPVPADVVGTDPRGAESADRGTGGYRVPSLFALAHRGRLLHDSSIADLDQLLDPQRRQTGPVGHLFGLELTPSARADLISFLEE